MKVRYVQVRPVGCHVLAMTEVQYAHMHASAKQFFLTELYWEVLAVPERG